MAVQVQFRRGTKAQHDAFTGATGEVTVNTTDKTLVMHDGLTLGGFNLARADGENLDLSRLAGVTTVTSVAIHGGTINNTTIGIGTSANGNFTNVNFVDGQVGSALSVGAATTFKEALVVNGDARVTGILTIGTSSIVIDGDNQRILFGGSEINGDGNINASTGIATYLTVDAGTLDAGANLYAVAGVVTTLTSTNATIADLNVTADARVAAAFTASDLNVEFDARVGSALTTLNLNVIGSGLIDTIRIASVTNEIDTSTGNLTLDSAGGTTTIDDDAVVTGDLTINGNLTVEGTETIINVERLDVQDKTVGVASTSTASNTTANGGGFFVHGGGDGDKEILWQNDTGAFEVNQDWLPSADGTYDLGASGQEWQDLYVDGTANIDSLVADTADINAGTIDGATIGGSSAAEGTFTNLTAADANITADARVGAALTVTGAVDFNGGLDVSGGETVLSSATVSDLTNNRVVLAGTSGALEDSSNLTFDGTTLAVTGNQTVTGTIDVDGQAIFDDITVSAASTFTGQIDGNGGADISGGETTLSSATVSDLTSGRVVLAGTSGALEDSGNLTFNGTTLSAPTADLTNATIDNLTFTSGTAITSVDTNLSAVSASDDTLASAKAIKSYVDSQVTAQDLDIAGDSGTGAVDLDSQTFTIAGTSNEIETSVSGQTVTIGLPNDVTVSAAATIGGALTVTGEATFQSNVNLGDSDILYFGAGNDLEIFHDGTNSYIKETAASGSLIVNGNWIVFKTADDNETYARFITNAQAELYYDNSKKFETTAYGVDVTGTTGTDGLAVSGVSTFTGQIDGNGGANISGGESILSSATVSDLTSGRVVLAGTSGAIEDSANLTFNGTTLSAPTADLTNATIDNLTFTSGTAITSVDTNLSAVSASDDTLASAKAIKSYVDAQITAQDLDFAGGTGTGAVDLDSQTLTIAGTTNEIETSASGQTLTIGLPSNVTITQDLTVARDLIVSRNLNVEGNVTIGGTSATIFATELTVQDSDIVLGFRTDPNNGGEISNDTTADHGGVAVASTEGTPLVSLYNPGIGESSPATYKKFMWFKTGAFSGLGTDAWLSNYAIGIGSTQVPNNVVLAAGAVNITNNDISYVRDVTIARNSTVGGTFGVTGQTTLTGLLDANGGATIDNVRIGVAGDNEIDTSTGNLTIDSAGGTTTIDDALSVTGNISGNLANTLTLNTSGTGLSGSQTYNNSGAATFTVTSNATSSNTGSAIVARDGSGNFSAGTITATLSGHADTATLADASTFITVDDESTDTTCFPVFTTADSGILSPKTGSNLTFNSANGTLTATTFSGSGASLTSIPNGALTNSTISGVSLGSNLATLTRGSYLTGSNYNGSAGQYYWSVDATTTNTASKVVARDGSGNFSAGTITADLSGNADTATLATASTFITVDDESTDTTCFPVFTTAASGILSPKTGTNLAFNSSNGTLTATTFSGSGASLTSLNASNISSGTINAQRVPTLNQSTTGNAATATVLQTARTINGVSFNGSANITVEPYIEDDESTNATRYMVFTDNSTAGHKRLNEDSSLTYNPSTNILTAGQFNATSDIKLKENITTIESGLDKVCQLRGVEFDFKSNGQHSLGVIAQEVEQVLPDLVSEVDGTKTVAYANLTAVLIEAVKELKAEVAELRARLDG
jgi:hypothetical protein